MPPHSARPSTPRHTSNNGDGIAVLHSRMNTTSMRTRALTQVVETRRTRFPRASCSSAVCNPNMARNVAYAHLETCAQCAGICRPRVEERLSAPFRSALCMCARLRVCRHDAISLSTRGRHARTRFFGTVVPCKNNLATHQ